MISNRVDRAEEELSLSNHITTKVILRDDLFAECYVGSSIESGDVSFKCFRL